MSSESSRMRAPSTRRPTIPALVAVGATVVLAVIGWRYRQTGPREIEAERGEWREILEATAADRAAAVRTWADQWLAEARTVAAFPTVVRLGGPALPPQDPPPPPPPPDEDHVRHLESVLTAIAETHRHRLAAIISREGTSLVESKGSPGPLPACLAIASRVARLGEPRVELHAAPGPGAHFCFAAPTGPGGARTATGPGEEAQAAAVIAVDPEWFLYPFLRQQPIGANTGEVLLVAPDDDDIVFLSPRRDAAQPGRRIARAEAETLGLVAAAAVLGRATFGSFRDHRGERVLAAVRPVESTTWAVLAKVDEAEAFGPIHERRREEAVLIALAGTAVLALCAAVIERQRRRAAQRIAGSEARFARLFENAGDAVFLADGKGRILEANAGAEALYGYGRGELAGRRVDELDPPGGNAGLAAAVEGLWADGEDALSFETEQVRRDGERVPVEVSAHAVKVGGERRFLAIVRDLRDRKAADERIRRLNALLAIRAEASHRIMRAEDPQATLDDVCRIAVETGGFRTAWINLMNRATGRWTRVAAAGTGAALLARHLGFRVGGPVEGSGISAMAVAKGRTLVVEDVATSALVAPWRDAALSSGIRSGAACPVRTRAGVVGAFGLSDARPGTFCDEAISVMEEIASDLGFALDAAADRAQLEEARRRAEAAEARDRARVAELETLLDTVPIAVLVAEDTECKRIAGNRAAHELFRIPPGRNLAIGGDDVPRCRILRDGAEVPPAELPMQIAAARGERTRDFEAEIVFEDGSRRTIFGHAQPICDGGLPRGAIGAFVDVSDLREAQATMRKVLLGVESAGEGVIITDKDGTIEYVNPACCRLSGYAASELVGRKPSVWKSGAHGEEVYRDLWTTILAGKVWSGALTNRRKDGRPFEVAVIINPVRDERGEVVGFVGVQRDISRERQLEAQLIQSQKLEAIGQLAGGIAHDFNNALSGVLGYCDLALADLDQPERLRETLDEIKKAGQRAAAIARQLLVFSRRQALDVQPTSVSSVVESLLKMLRRLLGETVTLVTDLDPALPTVLADVGQLEQLITNLCLNARDASQGLGEIVISTRPARAIEVPPGAVTAFVEPGDLAQPKDGTDTGWVVLSIADRGSGMSAEVKARLFEPFFTTKPRGRGTGLGLAVVHGIVAKHGGRIVVESELGAGTTFRIYLRAAASPAAAQVQGTDVAALPRGSERILVVDDDETVRYATARLLTQLGYQVVTAASGYEALGLADRRPERIDLLLTDVVMPAMSGPELAAELARTRPGLKTLFVSGYEEAALDGRWAEAEERALLQKPYAAATLARRVREVLEAA